MINYGLEWIEGALARLSGNKMNWCPVIVSSRQQVSPILSLVVISLLIVQ